MNIVSAATNDGQYVNCYDRDGNVVVRFFVTSGCIVGQPSVSGDVVSVVFDEGSWRFMALYDGQANLIRKTALS